MREPDPLLRRLQIGALVWCAGLAAGTLALFPDRPAIAGGVAGGGLLTAVSFYAIKSSIDAVLAFLPPASAPSAQPLSPPSVPSPQPPVPEAGPDAGPEAGPDTVPSRPSPLPTLLRLTGRYALLGVLAYVMIARLRLHPVGVIVGASALVASASFEAVRALSRPASRTAR